MKKKTKKKTKNTINLQRNGDILKSYKREINLCTSTIENKKSYKRHAKHKGSNDATFK